MNIMKKTNLNIYGAGLICNANDIELHNCHIDVELRHHHTDICHYHRDIEQRHYHAYIQLRKYHRKITLFIYHKPFKTRNLCIHKHKKHSYSLTQQFTFNTFTHAKIRWIPWTVIATFFKRVSHTRPILWAKLFQKFCRKYFATHEQCTYSGYLDLHGPFLASLIHCSSSVTRGGGHCLI